MGRSRPAKGQGYTTRVDGRKILTSKVLEERLEASLRQYQELLKQNQALREKEAEQLRCLDMYEAWVRSVGDDAEAAAVAATQDDSTDSSQLPITVRLHRRVQKLKQILRPHAPDTQTSASQAPGTAAAAAAPAAASHPHSSSTGTRVETGGSAVGTAASGDAGSAGSQGGGAPGASNTPDEMMAGWFASVTPEDLNYFRTMTPEGLAVRLRGIVGQVGLVHWASRAAVTDGNGSYSYGNGNGSSSSSTEAEVYGLLDEIGKICALQTMAKEEVMAKVFNMNLDTLQVEPWPKQLWPSVVAAAQLSPSQRKTLAEAYQTYRQQTAQLMEQQHGLMRQLQAILGVAFGPGQAAASSAAVLNGVRPAGPQHFMSLATGGAVPGDTGAVTADTPTPTAGAPAGAGSAAAADDAAWSPILDAVQPLSAEEFAMLTEYLQDCKDKAASGAAATAAAASTSTSSSWLAPQGLLVLPEAEKAEQLVQQLSRISGAARIQMHYLIICFVNLLTTAQRAECVLAAYPFMVDPPAFCGCVAEQEGFEPAAAP